MSRSVRFFLFTLAALLAPLGALAQTDQAAVPDEPYVLSAAYPNPFNPSTSFTLSVNERQRVRVVIYNMLGQPVEDLFDGVMNAGEQRRFTFVADDLPSGIYLYRVAGEHFTTTRQVTLLK